MVNTKTELEAIKRKIIEVVDGRLATSGSVLLNVIGIDIGEALGKLKFLTGDGLASFIRTQLGSKYELVSEPGARSNILRIVPAGAVSPEAAATPAAERLIFSPELWQAFTHVLAPNLHRAFSPTERRHVDSSSDEAPAGFTRIPDEVLPRIDVRWRPPQVTQHIVGWLEANKIDPAPFISKRVKASRGGEVDDSSRSSVLELVLSALDQAQLRSTSVSLDVIEALLRKRV